MKASSVQSSTRSLDQQTTVDLSRLRKLRKSCDYAERGGDFLGITLLDAFIESVSRLTKGLKELSPRPLNHTGGKGYCCLDQSTQAATGRKVLKLHDCMNSPKRQVDFRKRKTWQTILRSVGVRCGDFESAIKEICVLQSVHPSWWQKSWPWGALGTEAQQQLASVSERILQYSVDFSCKMDDDDWWYEGQESCCNSVTTLQHLSVLPQSSLTV